MRKASALMLSAVTVLSLAAPTATAAVTDNDRAKWAIGYVLGSRNDDGSFPGFSAIGSTADALVSMAATNRGERAVGAAVTFLRENQDQITGVGLTAKVVMGLVAVNSDPRDFEGRDLVAEITGTIQPDGRLGEGTAVFDHALGLLALRAAGESIGAQPYVWLVNAQCEDGGWQYDEPAAEGDDEHCVSDPATDYFGSDTNTTALAVMALQGQAGPAPDVNPFRFFRQLRDDIKGGWGYTWSFGLTDTNSTSLVIQAYAAAGKDLPDGAKKALRRLQYGPCSSKGGAFAFTYSDENEDGRYSRSERTGPDAGASIAGVLGLLEKPLPLAGRDVTRGAPKVNCG
ncbi:MAG: hypothetical protein ACLGHL_03580 [Actinomycetota bacterium]